MVSWWQLFPLFSCFPDHSKQKIELSRRMDLLKPAPASCSESVCLGIGKSVTLPRLRAEETSPSLVHLSRFPLLHHQILYPDQTWEVNLKRNKNKNISNSKIWPPPAQRPVLRGNRCEQKEQDRKTREYPKKTKETLWLSAKNISLFHVHTPPLSLPRSLSDSSIFLRLD